ncbi:Methyltransferase type 11 [Metarhizium robertsii ARSEF 23]|uniref:Methyltransferase type 11 n=2 Tax=Metarhizium robertsii TaxID=568076 RepID=E9EK35_METRA|nr:Methyltransferase type 11 [Metarhizium robertsii ARSEF 23]EFZ03046.2 Methyltransferase type 11 [Metarhizium robertsii ARSEF 23]
MFDQVIDIKSRIQQWRLNTAIQTNDYEPPTGSEQHWKSPCRDIPTPPPSNHDMDRSPSPAKKRRVGQSPVEEDDVQKTPTARSRDASDLPYRLSNPPSFAASESSAASSRYSKSPSRRSGSPTKRFHLQALKKPVFYMPLYDNATDQLPADVQKLYSRIYQIAVERDAFLPHIIRDEICAATGRHIKGSWFTTSPTEQGSMSRDEDRSIALKELEKLKDIVSDARDSQALNRSEASWNMEVHGPLLKLALKPFSSVKRELATTARILPPFVPTSDGAGQAVESKMIDFVLVLALDNIQTSSADKALAERIRDTVLSEPRDMQSVNQTQYQPVQFRPIGSMIETKVTGSAEEGRIQLGVSTAAWHQRIGAFLEAKRSAFPEEDRRAIATLPQLLVLEQEWKLYFACDRGNCLEMVGDMSVGDNKSLIGAYIVVAVVREIARYMTSTYKEFITHVFEPGI